MSGKIKTAFTIWMELNPGIPYDRWEPPEGFNWKNPDTYPVPNRVIEVASGPGRAKPRKKG